MSKLLRRRFFRDDVYEEILEHITNTQCVVACSSVEPECQHTRPTVFNDDTELCARMLSGLTTNEFGFNCEFWTRRMRRMFCFNWTPPNMFEASIVCAAQQACHKMVEAEDTAAAKALLEPYFRLRFPDRHWFSPLEATVKLAVITHDCWDTVLVGLLLKNWRPLPRPMDAELAAWCEKRIYWDRGDVGSTYRESRRASAIPGWPFTKTTGWVGEWVKHVLMGKGHEDSDKFIRRKFSDWTPLNASQMTLPQHLRWAIDKPSPCQEGHIAACLAWGG
ncbi:MAG: hypothetical protein M1829_002042 [Trizodia sp. TS-e1964]|nr:MAG: hypothetical protein M1829_002042 [Trizodia sp. TS-e1964]